MPAVADPPKPTTTSAPAAPAPVKPSASPTPPSKPKAPEAPAHPTSQDPLPDVPNEDNPFFALEERHGLGIEQDKPAKPSEPEEPTEVAEEEPEAPTEQPKAKQDKETKTIKPKTDGGRLREERDRIAKELEDYKRKVTEYESKLKEAKPAEEVTSLTERLAAIERERDEAKAHAMMLEQGISPEFKEKYEKPFNEAAEVAAEFMGQIAATQPDGTQRLATWKDFTGIYGLPYLEAKKRAAEMFGDESPTVMQYYNQLHSLDKVAAKAKEAEKAKWKETQTQRAAEQVKQREAWNAGLAAAREGLSKKFPQFFGDDPNDPGIGKALQEGKRLWEKQPSSFNEHVAKAAAVELAYVSQPRLIYELKKANEQLNGLRAKLKEYETSEPSSTKRKTETAPPSEADDENFNELRSLLAGRK